MVLRHLPSVDNMHYNMAGDLLIVSLRLGAREERALSHEKLRAVTSLGILHTIWLCVVCALLPFPSQLPERKGENSFAPFLLFVFGT